MQSFPRFWYLEKKTFQLQVPSCNILLSLTYQALSKKTFLILQHMPIPYPLIRPSNMPVCLHYIRTHSSFVYLSSFLDGKCHKSKDPILITQVQGRHLKDYRIGVQNHQDPLQVQSKEHWIESSETGLSASIISMCYLGKDNMCDFSAFIIKMRGNFPVNLNLCYSKF